MFEINVIDTVVWDFDGVLNRNIVNGEFIWHREFEAEFGYDFETFSDIVFNDRFPQVVTGEISLMDPLSDWAATVGYQGDLRTLLEYWFQNDYDLDERMLRLLARSRGSGVRTVLGTNNEAMRTQFIAGDLGFSERVDRIFASGAMGVAKPDPAFFEIISEELSVEPDEILLIDDRPENCEAALDAGWVAHYFDGSDYAGVEEILGQFGLLGQGE